MKKFTVLALLAAVVMAAPVFAVQRNVIPNPAFIVPGASAGPAGALGPATSNNNDSCDIGVTPAATLLLPYFEVETAGAAGTGPTTLFTITNTSRFAQIAHVTLWTDLSAPVLDFNIFLTGYDVQSINLYDVIVRGAVGSGTSSSTVPGVASGVTGVNSTPAANNANTNIQATVFTAGVSNSCVGLPGQLPPSNVTFELNALTTGTSGGSCATAIGLNHGTRAIGYVTVDLVANCNTSLPTDPGYLNTLLYDNVLIGDYQQLGPSPTGSTAGSGFDAGGSEMVHIRAVPEGGPSIVAGGAVAPTNLPFTFYNRYENTVGYTINQDRRQPLPSQWAARWIGGTLTNSGVTVTFNTDYKIWREGFTGATACPVTTNSTMPATAVRFDEAENSFGITQGCPVSPCPTVSGSTLPETSRVAVGTTAGTATSGTPAANALFPPLVSTNLSVGGWTYLNLSSGGSGTVLTASRAGFGGAATVPAGSNAAGTAATFTRTTSQNWVIVSMFGNLGTQRLAVDFNAAWLGNGCTPAPAPGAAIGPQMFAEPTGTLVCNTTAGPCVVGVTAIPVPNP